MLAGMRIVACLAGFCAACRLLPAVAQTAVGSFEDWTAVTDERGGARVCYVVAAPEQSLPENVKRGDVWVLVQHRPQDKVKDEVRVVQGYPLVDGGTVKVTVGAESFALFVSGEDAWAPTREADRDLVAAMKKGASMTVEGDSARGTHTVDTYSLAGFTAAHGVLGKACGG